MKFKSNIFHYIKHFNDLWNSKITFNATPLIHAAREDHFEIVELLLSQEGIEIDCENI